MCYGGGNNGSGDARAAEDARQARLRVGMDRIGSTFGQFGDQFYNDRAKAYTDYAMPQAAQQFKDANDQVTFGLARSGNINSSAGAKQYGRLQQNYNTQKQAIVGQGLNLANDARREVASQQQAVTNQLYGTSDPQAAGQSAINAAGALRAQPQFSPLGNLFQNVTGLFAQDANARAYGAPGGFGFQGFQPQFGVGAPRNTGKVIS